MHHIKTLIFFYLIFDLVYEEQNRIKEFTESRSDKQDKLKINGQFIHFSRRQMQCIEYLTQGMSIKAVAQQLDLGPRTIEDYVEAIKQKVGYRYKSELIKCLQENIKKGF